MDLQGKTRFGRDYQRQSTYVKNKQRQRWKVQELSQKGLMPSQIAAKTGFNVDEIRSQLRWVKGEIWNQLRQIK